MNETVAQIVEGTKVFESGASRVTALDGVSLAIEAGEFTAVAGPSGSGKTTLFNILGGLDSPTSGQVFLAGRPLSGMSSRMLAKLRLEKVGFVFQAYNLIPVLSAFENIEYPLILRKVPVAVRTPRVMEMLEAVGLTGMADRRPGQMSGGQQQRVAVARALVCDPALVLADEPTANLDSATGQALMDLMRRLNLEKGTTFLFSTHDQMVMDAATRLIKMKDGRVDSDLRGTRSPEQA
ncbi:MAG TPA: ABC transporter ATP-binding protein [Myxococcota bacterium]|nr:ABC transporter ATP-binding protein [Myxococcota bacterium]